MQTIFENYNKEKGGFDCASINEIKQVIKMGGNPDNISFSQIAKTKSEIIEAYNLGVKLTLVDCLEEVEKILQIKDKVKDLKILFKNEFLKWNLCWKGDYGVNYGNSISVI